MSPEEDTLRQWIYLIYRIHELDEDDKYFIRNKYPNAQYYAPDGYVTHLYVSNLRQIKALPEAFQDLTSLVHLRIDQCALKSLKFLPESLPHLQTLSLYDNHLTSLEFFPKFLPHLECLYISQNHLTSLSGLPESLPHLHHLNASRNHLENLMGLPVFLLSLESLDLHINHLKTLIGLPEELPSLTSLDLSQNILEVLPINSVNTPLLTRKTVQFQPLALHTLHGLDIRFYHDFFFWGDTNHLPPATQALIRYMRNNNMEGFPQTEISSRARKRMAVFQLLFQEYAPTVAGLVSRYLHGELLTPIQKDRIIYEGGYDHCDQIRQAFPDDSELLPALESQLHKKYTL